MHGGERGMLNWRRDVQIPHFGGHLRTKMKVSMHVNYLLLICVPYNKEGFVYLCYLRLLRKAYLSYTHACYVQKCR